MSWNREVSAFRRNPIQLNNYIVYFLEFRNIQFETCSIALSYEQMQQKKAILLVALYIAKNKGGGQKTR